MPDYNSCIYPEMRAIFIDHELTQEFAQLINGVLILWGNIPEPITLYIDTPGGDLSSVLAIHDIAKRCLCPIHTVTYHECMSAGLILFALGEVRLAAPNTSFLWHEYFTDLAGTRTEVAKVISHIDKQDGLITQILSDVTNWSVDKWNQAIANGDYLFETDTALEMGLATGKLDRESWQEFYSHARNLSP